MTTCNKEHPGRNRNVLDGLPDLLPIHAVAVLNVLHNINNGVDRRFYHEADAKCDKPGFEIPLRGKEQSRRERSVPKGLTDLSPIHAVAALNVLHNRGDGVDRRFYHKADAQRDKPSFEIPLRGKEQPRRECGILQPSAKFLPIHAVSVLNVLHNIGKSGQRWLNDHIYGDCADSVDCRFQEIREAVCDSVIVYRVDERTKAVHNSFERFFPILFIDPLRQLVKKPLVFIASGADRHSQRFFPRAGT